VAKILYHLRTDITPKYQTYAPTAMLSIKSVGRVPLENNSVAQATLQFERNITQSLFNQYPIIEEYRQHTFLDAISSIGGLLALIQGLHVLVFGRPLWWGLFGSKALNPFGVFGARSPGLREKMIAHYGYIPNPTIEDDSGAHKLGLFLSDFMLDVGPLYKGDAEMEQEEEGNIRADGERPVPVAHHLDPSFQLLRRRSDETAGVDDDIEMAHVLLGRNTTGGNTSE